MTRDSPSVRVLQHYLGNMPTLQPLPTLAALAADAGGTYVALRAQWFDLPQERVLRTLEMFRDRVLPRVA